jgi:asparagine synthase (glutamine-hydrolysing)
VNIRGFIDFYDKYSHVYEFENDKGVIVWNNGYIALSEDLRLPPFNIWIGVEKSEEVKLIGSKTPKSLTSSFAFTQHLKESPSQVDLGLWYDAKHNTLLVARHLFGMFPFYYLHVPNEFIAFSNNMATLVRMPHVREYLALDQNRIRGYATFRSDSSRDYSEDTFYQHIKTALPGQILAINPDSKSYSPFAQFSITQWAGLTTLPEYGEAFRELLFKSVCQKTADPSGLLGSHLSGGLDSSSISSIARTLHPERPLHTFYYSTRGYKTDDSDYARSVAENIGSIHHEVTQSTDDLAVITLNTSLYGRPQASIMSPTSEATVNRLANEIGCNVLMNGSDGDSIVGSGLELLEWLYRDKQWDTLKTLLLKRVKYFTLTQQYPRWDNLTFDEKALIVEQNFLYNRLTANFRKLGLSEFYKTFKETGNHFEISLPYFLKRSLKGLAAKLNNTSIQPITILRDEFCEVSPSQIEPAPKLSTTLRGNTSEKYQQWIADVYNQHSITLNEERFALGNFYGFKNTSPFYDKDLFELCISIPAIMKFGDGQGRAHFREAMKGILPEHVRVRHQKATVGDFGKQATLRLYEQSNELLMDSTEVWNFVDKAKFQKTLKFLKTDGLEVSMYNRSLFHITKTVSLAVWFEWLKSEGLPIKY